jgi:hypothetical protein
MVAIFVAAAASAAANTNKYSIPNSLQDGQRHQRKAQGPS